MHMKASSAAAAAAAQQSRCTKHNAPSHAAACRKTHRHADVADAAVQQQRGQIGRRLAGRLCVNRHARHLQTWPGSAEQQINAGTCSQAAWLPAGSCGQSKHGQLATSAMRCPLAPASPLPAAARCCAMTAKLGIAPAAWSPSPHLLHRRPWRAAPPVRAARCANRAARWVAEAGGRSVQRNAGMKKLRRQVVLCCGLVYSGVQLISLSAAVGLRTVPAGAQG